MGHPSSIPPRSMPSNSMSVSMSDLSALNTTLPSSMSSWMLIPLVDALAVASPSDDELASLSLAVIPPSRPSRSRPALPLLGSVLIGLMIPARPWKLMNPSPRPVASM